MDPALDTEITAQINAAISAHDVTEFKRITQQYPDWPNNNYSLGSAHYTAAFHLETFKALVERFPQLRDWDCGHIGNPVGLAAVGGDVELLRGLLEDVGLEANKGWVFYRPVLYVISDAPDSRPRKAEIIRLLKKHGATMEGESFFYQKSHRLWNGRLCWHRDGKPNMPRCSWSEEWDKTKGPVERIWNFFGIG